MKKGKKNNILLGEEIVVMIPRAHATKKSTFVLSNPDPAGVGEGHRRERESKEVKQI